MDSQEGKKTTTKKPHDPFCDWQNNGLEGIHVPSQNLGICNFTWQGTLWWSLMMKPRLIIQMSPTSSSHGSLKAQNFSCCGRLERDVMTMEEASVSCDLLSLKMKEGSRELWNSNASRNCNSRQLTASKEMKTSVLQPWWTILTITWTRRKQILPDP